jgi:hypothetical protein
MPSFKKTGFSARRFVTFGDVARAGEGEDDGRDLRRQSLFADVLAQLPDALLGRVEVVVHEGRRAVEERRAVPASQQVLPHTLQDVHEARHARIAAKSNQPGTKHPEAHGRRSQAGQASGLGVGRSRHTHLFPVRTPLEVMHS